ncbi:hypothetical protein OHA98_41870 [Streptomyces sp. NBC_00654]|uniref:hypothetical protein n=1 Tax=Streptomyces sp. NBC_00654 TaxID=2975799 RepID=UPI0022519320|nr:hypothetical protein [Streptomyces sp. NBC_00654]MCX4969377.1 hypothetical protein [Streptomyces sp. NBC_00654]MCX4971156.1 hypothetical protein [Streptomyces sp. NBC_00654]
MDNTTTAPAADHLTAALDEIRAWRHQHPHFDAPQFAGLDAILDRAAVGRIERRLDLPEATSLPEAVNAHHEVMSLRRRILADAARAWDLVEARAMRQIARFMPPAEASAEEQGERGAS